MGDLLSERYASFLNGSYDCVDRIVLNAYFQMGQSPGGFRTWWRKLYGTDQNMNDTHLMRLAGRFSRRVHAFAKHSGIMLKHCRAEERKHEIAEQHLPKDPRFSGLFLILVSRAPGPVWEVVGKNHLQRKRPYPFVNHYSFHIIDPEWGHLTIKLCGQAPFTAQIILNGHEYVARQAQKSAIGFVKEDNCFTRISSAAGLAKVADALRSKNAIGRLSRVCERWIYSSCLCFALDSQEQESSGFRYSYSVYQAEYSRNLLFKDGSQMEQIFNGLIDRTRAPLDVRMLKTIFGYRIRPHRNKSQKPYRCEAVVETPVYDLTVFKIHFGALSLKMYTKGERVLRIEAIVHNAGALPMGRSLPKFPLIVERLKSILERFVDAVRCVDAPFVDAGTLEALPQSAQLGRVRVGGVDLNRVRMRSVMAAVISLCAVPDGFSISDLVAKLEESGTPQAYTTRQAAYDLRKLRGKGWIQRVPSTRRYTASLDGLRIMAAVVVLRDKVIKPLLAGVTSSQSSVSTPNERLIDVHYKNLRNEMSALFCELGIAA